MAILVFAGFALWAADQSGTPTPSPAPKPATQPTTTTLPDGTPVTTNPDGSKTSQYEPGSSYTQNTDGSKTIQEKTPGPDGQPVTTKTTYKPGDGTRITEYPDDPTKKPVEEKPVTTLTGKKGQKTYTYSDGTIAKFKGDHVDDFEIEKHVGRETTKFEYDTRGGRNIRVSGYRPKPVTSGTGAKVSMLIDNRPEYNVCLAGDSAPNNLQESFYQQFKSAAGLNYSFKSLGQIPGYGQMFSTNAPMNAYNDWLQNSGNRSCDGFDRELNFCTLMAPLTAFRGHDHEHHRGGLHSHNAPDPPLNWGKNPPEIVIRLDRAR